MSFPPYSSVSSRQFIMDHFFFAISHQTLSLSIYFLSKSPHAAGCNLHMGGFYPVVSVPFTDLLGTYFPLQYTFSRFTQLDRPYIAVIPGSKHASQSPRGMLHPQRTHSGILFPQSVLRRQFVWEKPMLCPASPPTPTAAAL